VSTTATPHAQQGDLPWREQKKLRTRQALHGAARDLVLEKGLTAVTVDEICSAAAVSTRTFFNYFPSKAAAALGLPDVRIEDEPRDVFLTSTDNVVRDLCMLLGSVFSASGERLSDRMSKQDLIRQRPELQLELSHWMLGIRSTFLELAGRRLHSGAARRAVILVFAALLGVIEGDDESRADLGPRLWSDVRQMCELAACSRSADDYPEGMRV
jgi:AcrR family transcriptional regulator